MGDTIQGRLDFLQRQLHAIGLALADARARNDMAAVESLQALFTKVRADVLQLQRDALDADMPSDFMRALAAVGDEVVATGKALGEATTSAITGIGATLKYLPLILLLALVVVGLIYAGKIRKGL